jgi:hypothetical protein
MITKRKRAKTQGLLEQLRKRYGNITLSQAIEQLKPRPHGRPKTSLAPYILGYHVWFSVEELKAAGCKTNHAAHKAYQQLCTAQAKRGGYKSSMTISKIAKVHKAVAELEDKPSRADHLNFLRQYPDPDLWKMCEKIKLAKKGTK